MKTEEIMLLLRQQKKSYLWNKHISRWTDKDFENLKNGIEIPNDKKDKSLSNYTSFACPVKVTRKDGTTEEFKSIWKAGKALGLCRETLRYRLEKGKFIKGIKIEKI